MNNKRSRIGLLPVVWALFGMVLLGGCSPADPLALDTFVVDLLRNTAAALLL